MLNFDNTTLVIQGNIVKETLPFYKEHQKKFKNIIISTWERSSQEGFDCPFISLKVPDLNGPGNINLQLTSSKYGLLLCKTKFAIKCRTDIRIDDPEKWLQFCSEQYQPNRIATLGLSNKFPFSPRDQIFIAETDVLINMFEAPLMNESYRAASELDVMYPELLLGLNHCRKYDEIAQKCWENPHFVRSSEVLQHWQQVKTKYMIPVPTTLKFYWPKHFPSGYDYSRTDFGEFWFDTI